MPEPTKADLAGPIDARVRAVETIASEVRGAIRIMAFLFGPVFAALAYWTLTSLHSLSIGNAVNVEKMTLLEKSVIRIEGRFEDATRRDPVDKTPIRKFARTHLPSQSGTLIGIEKDLVTLEGEKGKVNFRFNKDAACFIGDREVADWKDVKGWIGNKTTVWTDDKAGAEIAVMEVEDPTKKPFFIRPRVKD